MLFASPNLNGAPNFKISVNHTILILHHKSGQRNWILVLDAFQNGGENLRRPYRAQKKIDFWRRGKAPPPKINQRKTFVRWPFCFYPKVETHPWYWMHFKMGAEVSKKKVIFVVRLRLTTKITQRKGFWMIMGLLFLQS